MQDSERPSGDDGDGAEAAGPLQIEEGGEGEGGLTSHSTALPPPPPWTSVRTEGPHRPFSNQMKIHFFLNFALF